MKHIGIVLALLVGSGVTGTSEILGQSTGAIAGTVTLEPPPPPRRSANRYPGGPQVAQVVQQTSAVVFLEGAVPGAKGGWITIRDAVKKSLPKDAPKPGKFRMPNGGEAEAPAVAEPAAEAAKPAEGEA